MYNFLKSQSLTFSNRLSILVLVQYAQETHLLKAKLKKKKIKHELLYMPLYCKKNLQKLFGHENASNMFSNVF